MNLRLFKMLFGQPWTVVDELVSLSRRKQGFESPRERQSYQVLSILRPIWCPVCVPASRCFQPPNRQRFIRSGPRLLTLNQRVQGSNPCTPTNLRLFTICYEVFEPRERTATFFVRNMSATMM